MQDKKTAQSQPATYLTLGGVSGDRFGHSDSTIFDSAAPIGYFAPAKPAPRRSIQC